ncbi:cysteine desulfurase-like protein [Blastococcus haudaquaticus]|uniref:Cysteine desulfurase family protein, VC1184 subfamily n=1 Tax=Blastococcus haudaquaticus TaxID=1938745 RepID=A0A286GHE4_9ACTN|nr:cysteine desulfurase-like protein [Blastococcus haudaquaticus]SOD94957.1 cysteine desulfurase family protein, VC1184 subfamily [Blastococcus haudaquaticus]
MSYDVAAVRAQFPALRAGTAHFDGPGGTQVPEAVARAVADTLTAPIANRGRTTAAERTADDVVTGARSALADLLGADPRGIVFGRSATQLTFDASRAIAAGWGPGDEVVVSRLDHDANIRPWVIAAEAAGATVRWAAFDPATGELTADDVAEVLTDRTRLVAVTGASNLIGTRPPVAAIAERVHAAGALLAVDGVHLTAHAPVDVRALGADLYTCSPYKFLGPHCGVLTADPALLGSLAPAKLLPSSDDVPERFELGTLPYELMAGTTAAIDFLAGLAPDGGTRRERLLSAMAAVEEYEDGLREHLEAGLAALPGVRLWSRAAHRTPTLLATFDGRDAADAYRFLAARGVNAPAGSFYAIEASRWLGLGAAGGLRVGLAPYSDRDDVDRLLTGLREWLAVR